MVSLSTTGKPKWKWKDRNTCKALWAIRRVISRWSRKPRALTSLWFKTRLAAATTSLESSGACTIIFWNREDGSLWACILKSAATSCAATFWSEFCIKKKYSRHRHNSTQTKLFRLITLFPTANTLLSMIYLVTNHAFATHHGKDNTLLNAELQCQSRIGEDCRMQGIIVHEKLYANFGYVAWSSWSMGYNCETSSFTSAHELYILTLSEDEAWCRLYIFSYHTTAVTRYLKTGCFNWLMRDVFLPDEIRQQTLHIAVDECELNQRQWMKFEWKTYPAIFVTSRRLSW